MAYDDALEEFKSLRDKASKIRKDVDKASAQYEMVMANIKEDFGVDSIKAAKKLLDDKRKEAEKLEADLEENVALLREAIDVFERS